MTSLWSEAFYLWLFRFYFQGINSMLPTELINQLNAAEAKLQAARAKDLLHDEAVVALAAAQTSESQTLTDANVAHQEATTMALDAVAALKLHFNLP